MVEAPEMVPLEMVDMDSGNRGSQDWVVAVVAVAAAVPVSKDQICPMEVDKLDIMVAMLAAQVAMVANVRLGGSGGSGGNSPGANGSKGGGGSHGSDGTLETGYSDVGNYGILS